jgi:hypothetical protein
MSSVGRCLLASFTIFSIIFLSALSPAPCEAAMIGPPWATKLVLYNLSNADTCVLITLGQSGAGNAAIMDGCPSVATQVEYKDLTINGPLTPLTTFQSIGTGWFILKRGHKVQLIGTGVDPYSKLATYCLQGMNIGFGGLPASSCPLTSTIKPNTTPGPAFNSQVNFTPPNGTNGFELSVNLPSLITNVPQTSAQESIDLTCEAGAMWRVGMTVTPPVGGPYWQYNAGVRGGGLLTYQSTFSSQNSYVKIVKDSVGNISGCDDNCVDPRTGLPRPGVFPYGCSACNINPDIKPQCKNTPATNPGQFCAVNNGLTSNNGCQLNRSPANSLSITPPPPPPPPGSGTLTLQKFGGTVQVNFFGPITPPAQCP